MVRSPYCSSPAWPACVLGRLSFKIRQAFDLADVRVVDAQPALRVAPLADPVDGIGHDVLDLEHLAVLEQPDALLHAELLGDRDAGVDVVVVRLDVPRVDDQRVAFPAADRLAVVGEDHRVGFEYSRPSRKICRKLLLKFETIMITVGSCTIAIGHTRVMIIGMPAGKHWPIASR